MDRLTEIGFVHVGHWQLEDDMLMFKLTQHAAQTNILYAFVCDSQVKYVGKTICELAVRMQRYKTPGTKKRSTNHKNHQNIRGLLSRGSIVRILARPDCGPHLVGVFYLNYAAGLEDDIIRVVNPEWNGRASKGTASSPKPPAAEANTAVTVIGPAVSAMEDDTIVLVDSERNRGASKGAASSPKPPTTETDSKMPIIGTFTFILQMAYYNNGFFNVGVDHQYLRGADGKKTNKYLLGEDGDMIKLFLGDNKKVIQGNIYRRRTVNRNLTPRIMGNADLINWFHVNAEVMQTIFVEVLSPTAIRLIPVKKKAPINSM